MDLTDAIVVGCDGDPDSHGALRFAAVEAEMRSARLVVLATFFRPVDPDLNDYDTPDTVLAGRARAAARRCLCQALGCDEPDLPRHEIVAARGAPGRVLLTGFGDAQLVVVGTHQRHVLSRLLHGPSTSADLIHHGQMPVAVVPPQWRAPTADQRPDAANP